MALPTINSGSPGGPALGLPVLDAETRAVCLEVAERLASDAEDLAVAMTAAVFAEIPAYGGVRDRGQEASVLAHSRAHVQAVILAIRTWALPSATELEFVRQRGALRASHGLPLNALLQSYRIGHRTVWQCLVRQLAGLDHVLEASLALTTLTLIYTELISGALAEGYLERQRGLLVEIDRDRRDLLEYLLQGGLDRQSDTARLASSFALAPGGDFVVIAMSILNESGGPSAQALTRAADTLRRHYALGVAQPFVVVRHGEIVSIAPLARVRAATIARLTRQAHLELAQYGERWAAGVSTVCAGLGEVARGYLEARRALDSGSAQGRVQALLDTRVSDYLLDHADGTALRMIPPAARRLFESTAPADNQLIETLRAYARADAVLCVTAERLTVHPNTVTYRLRKLGKLLERDLTRFSNLVEVLTWMEVIERAKPSA